MKTVFRYPGGKTKIASKIVDALIPIEHNKFVDVFAGGGSVFIEYANRNNNTDIIINDTDKYIFYFWYLMCNNRCDEIIDAIISCGEPTIDKFNSMRKLEDSSEIIMAFKALFFNRTTFSGIFSSGPIGGYKQLGKYKINCRYNANKIIEKLKDISISLAKKNLSCLSIDFKDLISKYKDDSMALLYLDPPYMGQGHQLYNRFLLYNDYVEMANLLKGSKCKWIISHDDNDNFLSFFRDWSNIISLADVSYTINSIKDNVKKELLVSNCLK